MIFTSQVWILSVAKVNAIWKPMWVWVRTSPSPLLPLPLLPDISIIEKQQLSDGMLLLLHYIHSDLILLAFHYPAVLLHILPYYLIFNPFGMVLSCYGFKFCQGTVLTVHMMHCSFFPCVSLWLKKLDVSWLWLLIVQRDWWEVWACRESPNEQINQTSLRLSLRPSAQIPKSHHVRLAKEHDQGC